MEPKDYLYRWNIFSNALECMAGEVKEYEYDYGEMVYAFDYRVDGLMESISLEYWSGAYGVVSDDGLLILEDRDDELAKRLFKEFFSDRIQEVYNELGNYMQAWMKLNEGEEA